MRRAMRHAHLMGVREPLLWRLVPALTREMSQAFPELARAEALISETLKLEETRFRDTLERGLRLLEEETSKLSPDQALPGEVAFRLRLRAMMLFLNLRLPPELTTTPPPR